MSTPRTQAARRMRITEVLNSEHIHSQEELRTILCSEGFDVTQATVSRDLLELGAVKASPGAERAFYIVPGEAGADTTSELARLARTAHELVVSVEHSANIVVVRTPPGAAQYFASALDRSQWAPVLGTVAGDDTVFLVTRNPRGGATVASELLSMAEGRPMAMGER